MIRKQMMVIFFILSTFILAMEQKEYIFQEQLNFQGLSLQEVGVILESESGVGIIVNEKIMDKKINNQISNGKKLDEVLEIIALSNELRITKNGENSYYIYEQVKGRGTLSGRVKLLNSDTGIEGVKVTILSGEINSTYTDSGGRYIVNNLLPGTYLVKYEKKGFLNEGEFVTIKGEEKTESINIFLKREDKIGDMEKTRKQSEEKTDLFKSKAYSQTGESVTEKIELINITSEEAKKVLESIFSKELVVTTIPKLSTILVKGDRDSVKIAKEIINDTDIKIKQVRIAAQTLEITDNLFEKLGFSWVYQSGSLKDDEYQRNGGKIGTIPNPIDGLVGVGVKFIRFFSNKDQFLNFSIDMLKGTSDAVVSAIPSILVVNGEEGKFNIVEETLVSYRTTSTSGNGDLQRNTEPIKGEAGIILKVTPIIRRDNSILLKIEVEVSNFLGNLTSITSEGGYNPKITRRLSTTVMINNKDTIFIGGMKSVSSNKTNSKIPILGDIPYIGKVFQHNSESEKIKDLYIKLKVEVVTSKEAREEMDYSDFKTKK